MGEPREEVLKILGGWAASCNFKKKPERGVAIQPETFNTCETWSICFFCARSPKFTQILYIYIHIYVYVCVCICICWFPPVRKNLMAIFQGYRWLWGGGGRWQSIIMSQNIATKGGGRWTSPVGRIGGYTLLCQLDQIHKWEDKKVQLMNLN